MRLAALIILVLFGAAVAMYSVDLSAVSQWVVEQQRAFQNQMAGAVRALKAGDLGAYAALFLATGAYGFVHAIGPGHGKFLVGGVGLGTTVSAARLVGIAVASSIAQSLWAIILVYGGFFLISVSAQQVTYLAEDILAPVSYLAIALVGLILVWRGARRFAKPARKHAHAHAHDHDHSHAECGCGAHGPSAKEIERVTSLREALILIASVAVRPCTGAIFLLVIAWQMDLLIAGALAVVVMGIGTAALTSLVAVSSVTARTLAFATATQSGVQATVFSATQVFAGLTLMWLSLGLLIVAL